MKAQGVVFPLEHARYSPNIAYLVYTVPFY